MVRQLLKTFFLVSLFIPCYSIAACQTALDIGGQNIVNANNIQLYSINSDAFPNSLGSKGFALKTDGNKSLFWELSSPTKLFYFMKGSPFGSSYDGKKNNTLGFIFKISSEYYTSGYFSQLSNDYSKFFALGDGTIKVKKAGSYSIECSSVGDRNVNSTAEIRILYYEWNATSSTYAPKTTLNSQIIDRKIPESDIDSHMILSTVTNLQENDRVGCQTKPRAIYSYEYGAHFLIREI